MLGFDSRTQVPSSGSGKAAKDCAEEMRWTAGRKRQSSSDRSTCIIIVIAITTTTTTIDASEYMGKLLGQEDSILHLVLVAGEPNRQAEASAASRFSELESPIEIA